MGPSGCRLGPWVCVASAYKGRLGGSQAAAALVVFRVVKNGREEKVPTKLKKHLETKKGGRQLHVINGSVYNRVAYSQHGMGLTAIWKHLQLYSIPLRGHWTIL